MVVTLGQQYNVGEKPAVILYTYINRHAEPPNIKKNITIIVLSNHTKMGARVKSKVVSKIQLCAGHNVEAYNYPNGCKGTTYSIQTRSCLSTYRLSRSEFAV